MPVACAAPPPPPRRLDLPTVTRRDAALDLGLVVLVGLLIPFGFQLAASLLATEDGPLGALMPVVVIRKGFDALLAVMLVAYLVHRHRLAPTGFGLQLDRWGVQVLWTFPILVAIYLVLLVSLLVMGFLLVLFPQLQQDVVQRTEFIEAMPLNNLTQTLLLLVPVAIHEEVLFRGLLIPYLRRVGCAWWLAVLAPTAVFALLHFNQGWLAVLPIFGVGAVLGTFFVLSRSLTAVILAHFLFNLLQFQLARQLVPWLEELAEKV